MPNFVGLNLCGGDVIWINPAHVAWVIDSMQNDMCLVVFSWSEHEDDVQLQVKGRAAEVVRALSGQTNILVQGANASR